MTLFTYPERLLAWRYMRSKRREGFVSVITLFSVLGITLGVATLILVTSLMNGIREEMVNNFAGLDGDVTMYGQGAYLTPSQQVAEAAAKVPGVVSAAERIEGQVMVSGRGRAFGAQVFGYRPEYLQTKTRLIENITGGSIETFGQEPGIIIGERLRQNMGIAMGDSITLISPEGRRTIAGMVPRIKSYPVTATFTLGQHALDAGLILMPFADAQTYFTLPEAEGGSASAIEVTAASREEAGEVAATLRSLDSRLRVYDWQQTNQSVFTALKIQRDVMFVILALIILVATFNIISSLIMLVQDKSGDIAILRTMGATRGAILRIFLLAGMSIGAFGTLLGFGLGVLAAAYIESIRHFIEAVIGQEILVGNIYFLSTLPTKTDPAEVLTIVGFSLLLSFLATLYPAWKAASTHPAEALRYE